MSEIGFPFQRFSYCKNYENVPTQNYNLKTK